MIVFMTPTKLINRALFNKTYFSVLASTVYKLQRF